MSKVELVDLAPTEAVGLVDFLAAASGLSKVRIKDAMTKGAVWLRRDGRQRRIRRARTTLSPGDTVSLYFDSQILSDDRPSPPSAADLGSCSVWIKPAACLRWNPAMVITLLLIDWWSGNWIAHPAGAPSWTVCFRHHAAGSW